MKQYLINHMINYTGLIDVNKMHQDIYYQEK